MDSYQQPHRYIGPPPPPSSADPYHHQPRPRPHLPPNGPLFSGQFQYPPPSHSPSPPTSQWVPSSLPPPPPLPAGSYAPPPYSYPSPIIHHAQFPPPPRPHVVAHLHPHPQVPQSYSQGNQEWSSSNWTPHQGWDYAANKGEEDWAAKARAWADAKNAMENQHSQSQFAPVGRVEEKSQYPQAAYSHFPDYQHQPSPLNYEKFSVALQPVHRPAISHYQEPASVSSESSYAPDGHQPHMGYDRSLGGDTSASLHHQKSLSTGPSVHQQEVPSSYSSVAGKEDTADQNEWSYKMSASQNSSAKEGEPPMHQPMPTSYSFGNQSAVPSTNLADQPLDFTPRFSHDHDMSSSYAYRNSVGHAGNIESVASISSLNSWPPPPPPPGMVYPSISPVLSSGSQHDPSIALPSVSGHTGPSFGRIAGPGISSAAPLGAVPFDLSAGTALPPIVFSNDTYGISNMSDRPKKAAVPNWLKEEIKKAVISTSTVELPKERTQLVEDEGFDKTSAKDDQTDTKSVDSFRSTEGDEDDEDSIEAARNAAINQEIKRLLTEVLLKVTDALFDEIATKVISEDDLTVEVSQSALSSNQILSPGPLQAPTPKAFAKVLVPSKAKEPDSDSNSEKSNSSFQGDVLGLANYASDEDLPISNAQNTANNSVIQQSNGKRILDNRHLETGNGSSLVDRDDKGRSQMNIESDATKSSSTIYDKDNRSTFSELNSNDVDKERGQQYSSMPGLKDGYNGGIDELQKVSSKIESRHPRENVIHEKSPKSSQGKEVAMKVEKNGRFENTIISSGKDHFKETETNKKRKDEKGNENRRRQDEKQLESEKTGDLKDRMKEKDVETGKKEKESESRKRHGSYEAKDDRKDSDRLHKSSARDGNDSRRESAKGKEEDRARQKNSSETSKHKSKNSSSNSGKARSSNENKCSSDGSDNSKRKPYSRKRTSSPSPDRSKRRQVSRSPHSKHSQRRHSPYSSFDGARGRRSRSRSRSPIRRQR